MAIKELKSLTFGDGDTYVIPAPEPTKWEDIQNNPFGGGSNTVSWASAGLDFYSLPEYTYVKVSNAMVTMNDLASITENDRFFTWVTDDGDFATYMTDESTSNPLELISKTSSGIPCILITDANGNTYDGVQFRVDGVYFWTGRDAYPVSVTVPGFGKFESSTTIDSKYLPEGLQTETITLSDTVMIDSIYDANGQLDTSKFVGKEMLSAYIKVSDASIYAKSFDVDGVGRYYLGEGTDEWGIFHMYTAEEIKDGFYRVIDIDENGNEVLGGYCAAEGSGYDPGLYLWIWCNMSFTFFYGAIFETRTPKPIDKKYLPDDIGGVSAEYVDEQINAALDSYDQGLSLGLDAMVQHTLELAQERIDSRTPPVTAEDNGKFLRVVDGAWSAVAVPNAEGVGF